MSIPEDIDGLDKVAYEQGRDPIDWATQKTVSFIDAHIDVSVARLTNPAAFPGYCIPLTFDALARRIVGGLLDAGWTPPALGDEERTA
jgi:hypothetical protein